MDLGELGKEIAARLPGAVTGRPSHRGELTLDVEAGEIVRVLKSSARRFRLLSSMLIDICGVDWPQRAEALRCRLSSAVADEERSACA